ncbi:MAG: type II secretion system protein [bacterium]
MLKNTIYKIFVGCIERQKKMSGGFTLVESLIAISILMIAIVGPMTIVQNGMNSTMYDKEQFVAQFLAQEGLEYVRNIRDNSTDSRNNSIVFPVLPSIDEIATRWLSRNLSDCIISNVDQDKGCAIDVFGTVNSQTKKISLDGDSVLYLDNNRGSDSTKTYGFDRTGMNMTKTNFSRIVKIEMMGPEETWGGVTTKQEAKVTSTVSWTGRGSGTYSLITYIFNYR